MFVPKPFITTIALAVAIRAAPQAPITPPTYYCPVVDSTEEVAGKRWQIGVNVAGGSSISISEEHTEGLEWTFGSDLGINAGQLSLGGSWSVAESVSDSFDEGAAPDCPPGKWRCSIVVTPSVVRVKGHLKRNAHDEGCKDDTVSSWDGGKENDKFEYLIPIKDKAGNAQVSIDLCTCKNRKNWADPGHPGILCPKNCGSS